MSDEEKIRYRDAFPKDYDLPTYFTSKHAVSMTLRDYFAAKAMQAFISSWVSRGDYPETDMVVVEHAYSMADAMLKAREE
jgi:hypothetical protein